MCVKFEKEEEKKKQCEEECRKVEECQKDKMER